MSQTTDYSTNEYKPGIYSLRKVPQGGVELSTPAPSISNQSLSSQETARASQILNNTSNIDRLYQNGPSTPNAYPSNIESFEPLPKPEGFEYRKRIEENEEVDRRSFLLKALPSLLGIAAAISIIVFAFVLLPSNKDDLPKLQELLATGSIVIGSWEVTVNSVVAAISTLQRLVLAFAISVALPLLTWYYICKIGIPYTFFDESKSIAGNMQILGTGKYQPYVIISVIFLIASGFPALDNVAMSAFVYPWNVYSYGLVPTINVSNLANTGFYSPLITDDIKNNGIDVVYREGSQPFHSAVGSVTNGFADAEYIDLGSNFLTCSYYGCSGAVTVLADYNTTCKSKNLTYDYGNYINSNVYGIFGVGPKLSSGQVYYRIGNQWTVSIKSAQYQTSIVVDCITFAAKKIRHENSSNSHDGYLNSKVIAEYSVPVSDEYINMHGDNWASVPYDNPVPYSGPDFPIADPDDPAKTPLPYYLMGSLSLMLHRSAIGNCTYGDHQNQTRLYTCGDIRNFLFDFPFEFEDTVSNTEAKMRMVIENYYQFMYQLRFDHTTSNSIYVPGTNYYSVMVTNKGAIMGVIVAFNLFSIVILGCAVAVVALVDIPKSLGVLQLSILSYRSRLFEHDQYSSEEQLKGNFVVKVVAHEGIFWLKRQD